MLLNLLSLFFIIHVCLPVIHDHQLSWFMLHATQLPLPYFPLYRSYATGREKEIAECNLHSRKLPRVIWNFNWPDPELGSAAPQVGAWSRWPSEVPNVHELTESDKERLWERETEHLEVLLSMLLSGIQISSIIFVQPHSLSSESILACKK